MLSLSLDGQRKDMSAALLKGLAELVLLFCGSVILFLRKKMMCSFFSCSAQGV